jgi:hypothetical protein
VSRTEIKYGRWVREGDAEELVCTVGRCSDECTPVKRDDRTLDRTGHLLKERPRLWQSRPRLQQAMHEERP